MTAAEYSESISACASKMSELSRFIATVESANENLTIQHAGNMIWTAHINTSKVTSDALILAARKAISDTNEYLQGIIKEGWK